MKKVCIITATRAEYGILEPLLYQIKKDKELELQLIVTGTHLLKEFGSTYKEIKNKFTIDKKIAMDLSKDDKASLSFVMAQLQKDITHTFLELSPDIIIILGDRYEMLSVAIASLMLQIPIAHIHGGELTQGAIDDSIRHAITKLSHLHFTSTQKYANRIIQMGENSKRVFNVGALGVENIKKIKLLSKKEFEESINFKLHKKNILVTYHPQTLSHLSATEQMQELLTAFDTLEETGIIFTKANADEGGKIINAMIDKYAQDNPSRVVAFKSLGQLRYFSAIKYVDVVVGNSSSGILEVPSFKKPTINIGERQEGRIKAKSIIDTSHKQAEILQALDRVYSLSFQKSLKDIINPHGEGETSKKIANILKNVDLNIITKKSFFDIGSVHDK